MSEPSSLRAPSAELVASMLAEGLEVRLRLAGGSMRPWLRSGAVLRFSARNEPVVGDVALTRHPNDALVVHRIVALGEDWIQTKGDACRILDARVPRSSLLGCAVGLDSFGTSVPLGNESMRLLGTWTGRLYPALATAFRRLHPRRGECA